ncbi:hypothetical protein K8R33_00730 [archaeon]|nr:hypothetical protein [archaeon]
MEKKPIGKITHYFDKIGVAVLKLDKAMKTGDKILIGDGDEAFEQVVKSMQVDHEQIEKAKKGQEIGMKLNQKAKQNWNVYKA